MHREILKAERLDVARRHARQISALVRHEVSRVESFDESCLVPASVQPAHEVFIDWLNISQNHYREIPVVGDGVRVKGESFEQVEVEGEKFVVLRPGDDLRYSMQSKKETGSHSTSLMLRSDGHTVKLSGNPGRFDRFDNVFNYQLDDTIAKASAIVGRHGLPAFSVGERIEKTTVSERDKDLGLFHEWTGAVIREMHVTKNMSAGNEALAKEFMRWASTQRAARISKGVFGDETVVFGSLAKRGGTFHKAIVVYRKAAEMLAHAKGDEAKAAVKASPEYQFAHETGLVRIECKWGSHFLRDNASRYMGDANMAKIISLFERETAFLLDANPDGAVRIVSEMPRKLRLAALAWIRGDDLAQLLTRATYFRTVKALRDYGIDASEPRRGQHAKDSSESSEAALQAMLDALPSFQLQTLHCPDWYGLPDFREAA